jgi:hypothetical protein
VRKATLAGLLARSAPGLRFNEHLDEHDGPLVFQHACKLGLEGIVSKRRNSPYRSGRSPEAQQGMSVTLGADDNLLIVGGPGDNSNAGAAWVFQHAVATTSSTLQVTPSSTLQVTPSTNIVASGPPGGPFSPSTFNYTLTNSQSSISYTITNVPSWLTASPLGGQATNSGTTVTFSIDSGANSLKSGTYIGNINFIDSTGSSRSLLATLTVAATQ